jgi:hypothetical protein
VRDVVEEWPDMAIALATGWFDLDDVSPEVAKELAAELALFIRKLQDSQTGQRALAWRIDHASISSM